MLPQLAEPDYSVRYVTFNGKQDLDKQLVRTLRSWRSPDTIFVVLRDQDS